VHRFRWVVCQLNVLRKCLKERLIKQALATLPAGLDETYLRIFQHMPEEYRQEIKTIMAVLAFSSRPMTIQEVAEATAIKVDEGGFAENERFPDPYDLLELCPGLLTLSPIENGVGKEFMTERRYISHLDKNWQILQFAHFSVKEFVLSDRIQRQLPAHLTLGEASSQVLLARACLIYILDFNGGQLARKFDHVEYPLLVYSSIHWKKHWDAIPAQEKYQVEDLIGRLFDTDKSHALSNYLNLHNPAGIYDRWMGWGVIRRNKKAVRLDSALFQAAFCGFQSIVEWIVEQRQDALDADAFSNALGAACVTGNVEMVEFFIFHGANPNGFKSRFDIDRTYEILSSLQAAAYAGKVEIIKILVDHGAEVNLLASDSGSALHIAASCGHNDVVEALLDACADINLPCKGEGTPLHSAAGNEQNSTALFLLQRHADPTKGWSPNWGSALSTACMKCNFEVVKAIVEAGADHTDPSALNNASKRADLDTMKFLIERGANVNASVGMYGSPFQASIQSRSVEAFELMIENGADVNIKGGYSGSALGQAVFSRNIHAINRLLDLGVQGDDISLLESIDRKLPDIAKALLERGANPNAETLDRYKDHGNALQFAITEGRDDIAIILLDHGADVNIVGGRYGMPLQSASARGQLTLVRELLQRGAKVNTEPCGKYANALQAAAFSKNLDVLELLLNVEGIDVNVSGGEGGTALQTAVEYRREDMVKLLLSRGADVNILAGECGSPLGAAIATINIEMAKFLLDCGADCTAKITANCVVSSSPYRTGGMEEFSFLIEMAAYSGDIALFKLLLDHGADINCNGNANKVLHNSAHSGEEMLKYAVEHGADVRRFGGNAFESAVRDTNFPIVEMLVKHGANVNTPIDKFTGTPLHLAADRGHVDIVCALLDAGADINNSNSFIGTPLQEAIRNGHYQVAELLIERQADINVIAGKSGCALSIAICEHDEEMFNLLLSKGADININCGEHGTPLEEAIGGGQIDFAEKLLDLGANVNAQGMYVNALIPAGRLNSTKAVELIKRIISLGIDINSIDDFSGSILHMAAWIGSKDTTEFLIESGADINRIGGAYGTPLQAAIMGSSHANVELLLSKGANVNIVAGRMGTALQAAAWQDDNLMIRRLLEAGADVNLQGGIFGSALQAAGSTQSVQMLIEQGAFVNTFNGWYGSPLHAAARSGRPKSIKLLIDHGADVNHIGGKHGSTLQAAACHHHDSSSAKVIKLLIEAGADVNTEGGCYGTALQAAAYHSKESSEAVKILLEHGAKVNVKGGRFGSALNAARSKKYKSAEKLLLEHGALEDRTGPDFVAAPKQSKPEKPKCYLAK
jgi:ankyrin repeat protein